MCHIVAARGRQAAADVALRLAAMEPSVAGSPPAIAELAGGRILRSLTILRPPSWVRGDLVWREPSRPAGRLAIGSATDRRLPRPATPDEQPASDCGQRVAVVCCGAIDNAADLRAAAERLGHRFATDVPGEVIAHLVEDELRRGAPAFDAFETAIRRLAGAWAVAALLLRCNAIFVACHGRPLVLRGTVGRCVVATDPAGTVGVRGPLRWVEDGTIAELGTTWRWGGRPGRPPAPAPRSAFDRRDAPPNHDG